MSFSIKAVEMNMAKNPLKMMGIDFVEFSTSRPEELDRIFRDFGFSKIAKHADKNIDLYRQGGITFLLNYEKGSLGSRFQELHGPSISAMGWRFENASAAHALAVARGAEDIAGDYNNDLKHRLPAVKGIGDSLIYFTQPDELGEFSYERFGFRKLQDPLVVPEKGFLLIDHLTNNVFQGTMQKWADFYKDIFDFEEVRYFDIKGEKTGLTSYALRSPCGLFCIPINEASDAKSQINEYLEEYRGPGVQHLAFLTKDLLQSMRQLQGTSIHMLDISPDYYKTTFERVPNVKEDRQEIQKFNVLVDGDSTGYLLQIFTQNLVGPIFVELIQRENHKSFGEGNFQALFESIERDQIKRGRL
jgi:4-hydroxyphenylpyruvate dioxygenase